MQYQVLDIRTGIDLKPMILKGQKNPDFNIWRKKIHPHRENMETSDLTAVKANVRPTLIIKIIIM